MIRTAAVPRGLRVGAAAASVAGLALLVGCADTAGGAGTPGGGSGSNDPGSAGRDYADGTYTAEGSYQTPESVETISVTITLEAGAVTNVEVTGDPRARESQQYQSEFIGGISDHVVGKRIDEIRVDRVGGSSLTSGGFNAALDEIRSEAAA